LIGTAIGTALLPTLSEYIAKEDLKRFEETIQNVGRVLVALAIPAAILLSAALEPFLAFAFSFDASGTNLLIGVTRAFLVGLLGHVFLELGARIFFAQQNARIPLIGAGINLFLFIFSSNLLADLLGAVGVGLADAIAFSGQALFLMGIYKIRLFKSEIVQFQLITFLKKIMPEKKMMITLLRTLAGSMVGGIAIWLVINQLQWNLNYLVLGVFAAFLGVLTTIPFIIPELRLLLKL
jgi:putative peptidoglycan lipid II flippase